LSQCDITLNGFFATISGGQIRWLFAFARSIIKASASSKPGRLSPPSLTVPVKVTNSVSMFPPASIPTNTTLRAWAHGRPVVCPTRGRLFSTDVDQDTCTYASVNIPTKVKLVSKTRTQFQHYIQFLECHRTPVVGIPSSSALFVTVLPLRSLLPLPFAFPSCTHSRMLSPYLIAICQVAHQRLQLPQAGLRVCLLCIDAHRR
jgi:hypothetical protein